MSINLCLCPAIDEVMPWIYVISEYHYELQHDALSRSMGTLIKAAVAEIGKSQLANIMWSIYLATYTTF